MNRVHIFIDWWNFVLDWEELVGKTENDQWIRINWNVLPKVILEEVSRITGEKAEYNGTYVYASVSSQSGDIGLRRFLNTLRGFPGYTINIFERKSHRKPVRCNECRHEVVSCPNCSQPYKISPEKGVDTALVTEMIKMAYDDVYDSAALGSTDADLCGAIEFIQNRFGKKIYHLAYPSLGVDLRNTCWTHLRMNALKEKLKYTPKKNN